MSKYKVVSVSSNIGNTNQETQESKTLYLHVQYQARSVSIDPNPSSGWSLVPLPESYTLVPPASIRNKDIITASADIIAGNEMLPQSWKRKLVGLKQWPSKSSKNKLKK